jgi:hypothetical protein
MNPRFAIETIALQRFPCVAADSCHVSTIFTIDTGQAMPERTEIARRVPLDSDLRLGNHQLVV